MAGPVESCYQAAEDDNPGLEVAVLTGSTVQLTSIDLDAVFDEVAEHHTAPDLTLTYNAAGRAALRAALDCVVDNGYMTLSSIVLNEKFPDLQVRSYTILVRDSSEQLVGRMIFGEVGTSTCSSDTMLSFVPEPGSTEEWTLALTATPRGTHDFESPIDVSSANGPGCIQSSNCSGICVGECTDENPQGHCVCDGAGTCDSPEMPNAFGPSNTAMATIQF